MANKQRIVVDSGISPAPFRPAASPVSTYVRPTAGRKLAQLAAGLSGIAPQLARFSDQLAEEQAQRQSAEGEQMARRAFEEGKTYREAIEGGLIRPDQSPWYRWGAKQFFGRNAASTYSADLAGAVKAELGEAYEVGAFDEFEREFRKKWMSEHVGDEGRDTAFEQGFGKEVDARVAGLRSNFAVEAGARLQKLTLDNVGALITEHVLAAHAWSPDETETDAVLQQAAAAVTREIDRLTALGQDRRVAVRAAQQAILGAAAKAGDADLTRVLDYIVVDQATGAKLGSVPEVVEQVQGIRDQIITSQHRAAQVEREREAWRRIDGTNEILSGYLATLSEASDPYELRPEPIIARLKEIGATPDAIASVYQLFEATVNGRNVSDPQVVDSLFAGVISGTTTKGSVLRAMRSGVLNASDARPIWNELDQIEQRRLAEARAAAAAGAERRTGAGALFSPVFQYMRGSFERMLGDDTMLSDEEAAAKREGIARMGDLWMHYYYNGGGAQASPTDQLRYLETIGESVKRGVMGRAGAGTVPFKGNPWERPLISASDVSAALRGQRTGRLVDQLRQLGVAPQDAPAFLQSQARVHGINPAPPPPPPAQAPARGVSRGASSEEPKRAAPTTRSPERPARPRRRTTPDAQQPTTEYTHPPAQTPAGRSLILRVSIEQQRAELGEQEALMRGGVDTPGVRARIERLRETIAATEEALRNVGRDAGQ